MTFSLSRFFTGVGYMMTNAREAEKFTGI